MDVIQVWSLDEVLVGPGQPVVHHVGGDHLDEEEGELLARLLGRVAQLLLLLQGRNSITHLKLILKLFENFHLMSKSCIKKV